VPDEATASKIRNFINNRNSVFYRWDTDVFYFFDPQKATFTGNFTEANTLDGYITGSDNGDTDVRTNLTLVQPTLNDQPSTDGYKITFNDTLEHLEFENGASQNLAGWQICGTSKGTFAYKVNNTAVTELTMLGNAGTYRAFGDLYGIILLPESATGRDIEEARKLLIDRGASDAAYTGGFGSAWLNRTDIVEFKQTEFQGANNLIRSWKGNSNLVSFSAIQATNSSNFVESWQNCSSLTSFPQDAKLGTEASNVNFTSAWNASGLTSFSTPLPTATSVISAWQLCTSLTSFNTDLPLVTSANQAWYGCSSLTSFSSSLPSATNMYQTWRYCSSLSDFSADVFSNWNPSSINSGVFNNAWTNCPDLTAQSVENILVPIDSSGKHGTSDGTSGGTPLADAGIDVDYDGSGLTAATTAAITSLKSKGWSIFINSVEQ